MGAEGRDSAAVGSEDEEGEMDVEDSSKALDDPTQQELLELQKEIDEMKEELLDCGIRPGDLNKQPEMMELYDSLNEVKTKMKSSVASRASGSSTGSMFGRPKTAAFALGASSAALLALLRPRCFGVPG